MSKLHHGRQLGQRLIDAGLCPKMARNAELHVGVDDVVFVRYEVIVDELQLHLLGAILTSLGKPEPSGDDQ